MTITFEGPAVLVRDIATSRTFYETVLGQEVLADHGPHVAFCNKFSIWQADHASEVVSAFTPPAALGQNNFELYFESAALDEDWKRIEVSGAEIVHPIVEQPWGQRCFRIRDLDGHMVEVGEPLPVLIHRLLDKGLSPQEVSERTSIPLPFVLHVAEPPTEKRADK